MRAFARPLIVPIACAAVLTGLSGAAPVVAAPVPDGPGKALVPRYIGSPAVARPVAGRPVPANPYMGPPGVSAMHSDAYSSDTHPFAGPLGRDPKVTSVAKGGPCTAVTRAKSTGLLISLCAQTPTLRLRLMDPRTYADLAGFDLPPRPSTVQGVLSGDLDKIFTDTSGGAYFYLDERGRVVLADSAFRVRRFAHGRGPDGKWRFTVADSWHLSAKLPHDCPTWTNPWPKGQCDPVTSVAPDWRGLIWWATRQGRIGTIDPRTGRVRFIRFRGEGVQNSLSSAENGVSVVSDHALYLLRAAADGTPKIVWRRTYDRGTRRKPGQLDQGSGTTPTFLGGRYVAITDNADERMHVLVHRRTDGRLVCKVPVFGRGRSATDNSLIGFGDSLVVENNYGYRNFVQLPLGGSVPGGLTRIDVRPDGRGCRTVWHSRERSPSVVAKLSVATGLVYAYTKEPRRDLIDAWYLTAIDFRTGRTVWRVLTGTGKLFDNNWTPISLLPGGTAVVSLAGGLAAVRDGR